LNGDPTVGGVNEDFPFGAAAVITASSRAPRANCRAIASGGLVMVNFDCTAVGMDGLVGGGGGGV
jgi:hypothetical protein